MTYPSSEPVVPPARAGHRRRFGETERSHILAQAAKPGTSVSEVARRYGIARRVLFRWRQELSKPTFVEVELIDTPRSGEEGAS
jgi:transposase-like protein